MNPPANAGDTYVCSAQIVLDRDPQRAAAARSAHFDVVGQCRSVDRGLHTPG